MVYPCLEMFQRQRMSQDQARVRQMSRTKESTSQTKESDEKAASQTNGRVHLFFEIPHHKDYIVRVYTKPLESSAIRAALRVVYSRCNF